jgi:hypothetical protein
MALQLADKYHNTILESRERAANGSFRERVRYDLIERPNYACGLLAAADMARFCGVERITAIEFGVAEGHGLRNMCELAAMVMQETGVEFDIIGFDTGAGLPELEDYRDHPEIWSVGDFAGANRAALEQALPRNARIVWGDIRDTLDKAIVELKAPVGFIANDLDLYSSTVASFPLLEANPDKLLPVIIAYFDDTLGSPSRIGSLFRNRWCGQLAAIDDFNREHRYRKIDHLRTLKARRPLDKELWLDQMYGVHVLDHPFRQVSAQRNALKMDEHGHHDPMAWLL